MVVACATSANTHVDCDQCWCDRRGTVRRRRSGVDVRRSGSTRRASVRICPRYLPARCGAYGDLPLPYRHRRGGRARQGDGVVHLHGRSHGLPVGDGQGIGVPGATERRRQRRSELHARRGCGLHPGRERPRRVTSEPRGDRRHWGVRRCVREWHAHSRCRSPWPLGVRDRHLDGDDHGSRARVRPNAAHDQRREVQDDQSPEESYARACDLHSEGKRRCRRVGPGRVPTPIGQPAQDRSHRGPVLRQ